MKKAKLTEKFINQIPERLEKVGSPKVQEFEIGEVVTLSFPINSSGNIHYHRVNGELEDIYINSSMIKVAEGKIPVTICGKENILGLDNTYDINAPNGDIWLVPTEFINKVEKKEELNTMRPKRFGFGELENKVHEFDKKLIILIAAIISVITMGIIHRDKVKDFLGNMKKKIVDMWKEISEE